jgi:hypothetical protein
MDAMVSGSSILRIRMATPPGVHNSRRNRGDVASRGPGPGLSAEISCKPLGVRSAPATSVELGTLLDGE